MTILKSALTAKGSHEAVTDGNSSISRLRFPWLRLSAVVVLLAIHLAVTAFVTQPGHLSIDEGVYHQMARGYATSGTLSVWNGYDEFPSDELKHPVHIVRDGQLYPQYPYLTAVVAWPFYQAMGYGGLFVMNAIAFIGVGLLCFLTARRIFGDDRLALDSVIILTVATFAWQYSQEAWPHALSLLFVMGALYGTIRGLSATDPGARSVWAATAGLLIGLGCGVRIDVFFAAPVAILPYLFLSPSQFRPAIAATVGLLPGLSLLAATNYLKFGLATPFTYGAAQTATGEILRYLPVGALGVFGIAAIWALSRPRIFTEFRARPVGSIAAGLALLAIAFLVPPIADGLSRLFSGALQLIVDFRYRDPQLIEPGMSRTASGAIVYMNALKKSLMQSLPWLPLLALPLAALIREGQPHRYLGALFITCAGYLAVYSFYAWHGGLALNLRYFLPLLTPFAILAAWALRDLAYEAPRAAYWIAIPAAPAAFLLAVFLFYREFRPEAVEFPLLSAPLALAAMLAGLLFIRAITHGRARKITAGASFVIAIVSMAWASAGAISYDYAISAIVRSSHAEKATSVAPYIEENSILFVLHETPYFGLYDMNKVRLAATNRDDFASFRALLDHHLEKGTPVYLALGDKGMATARERGLLDGLSLRTLSDQLLQVEPIQSTETEPRPETALSHTSKPD